MDIIPILIQKHVYNAVIPALNVNLKNYAQRVILFIFIVRNNVNVMIYFVQKENILIILNGNAR